MKHTALKVKAALWGALGTSLLLTVFFSVVSLISGWDFAKSPEVGIDRSYTISF